MDEAAELRSRVINFTAQGNVDDARLLLESALLLDEAARGSLHPVVATDLNSLASILQSQGELETGRSYWERALGIPDKTLPPNHPTSSQSAAHPGRIYLPVKILYRDPCSCI